jgi:hypothetical protein
LLPGLPVLSLFDTGTPLVNEVPFFFAFAFLPFDVAIFRNYLFW